MLFTVVLETVIFYNFCFHYFFFFFWGGGGGGEDNDLYIAALELLLSAFIMTGKCLVHHECTILHERLRSKSVFIFSKLYSYKSCWTLLLL